MAKEGFTGKCGGGKWGGSCSSMSSEVKDTEHFLETERAVKLEHF